MSLNASELTAHTSYPNSSFSRRARAKLGSDAELTRAMLEKKQFRSLATRVPWAVFGLLPPFVAMALGLLPIGSLVLVAKYFGFHDQHAAPPDWFQALAYSVVDGTNLMIMPLAAILFVAIASRQRLGLTWPLIATGMLLILFVHSEARFVTSGHFTNSLLIRL